MRNVSNLASALYRSRFVLPELCNVGEVVEVPVNPAPWKVIFPATKR